MVTNRAFSYRWINHEQGRGNPHLRTQVDGEERGVGEVEGARKESTISLFKCANFFLYSGAAVTLVTANKEVLSKLEVPELEGELRIEDLETFERSLGVVKNVSRRQGRGEKRISKAKMITEEREKKRVEVVEEDIESDNSGGEGALEGRQVVLVASSSPGCGTAATPTSPPYSSPLRLYRVASPPNMLGGGKEEEEGPEFDTG